MFATLLLGALLSTDSTTWIVSNHGRPAGDLTVVRHADSVRVRYVFTDRNRGTRLEQRYAVGADGRLARGASHPVLADGSVGAATERYELVGDSIRYRGRDGAVASTVALPAGAFVALRTATPFEQAALARHLLARPDGRSTVGGAGEVRAQVVAETTVVLGGRRERARLVMIWRGRSIAPNGVWLDAKGELLANDVQWFITVRPDAVPALPVLRRVELRWRDAQAEAVAAKVRTPVAEALVVRGADLFDSERGVLVPRQTIVVRGDRIVAVGPADSVAVPAGATVLDGTGKTVLPGLWDMHGHLQVSNQGSGSLTQLAQGITTVRDLASDVDVAVSQRDRERAGRLASPRVVLAGFLEGPLAWSGPSEAVVSTEAEVRAWVARYDSLGYRQIKLYNVFHPDLVPVVAAEAKRRGMRLSGHIPRGLSVRAAVTLGYDEIQHAAFLLSDFFPDSLFLPQMRAYSQVATAVAPTFDVDGAPMTALLRFLAQHQTVIDGTFNLWIGRGAQQTVGAGTSPDQAKADSVYMRLLRRLHDEGVPLLAGTDNSSGITYHRELQLYAQAGIPVSKVLQIATIEGARFLREERDHGSVAVGKVADLIVVNGRPTEALADLAKVESVVRGGRLYRVKDLTDTVSGTR